MLNASLPVVHHLMAMDRLLSTAELVAAQEGEDQSRLLVLNSALVYFVSLVASFLMAIGMQTYVKLPEITYMPLAGLAIFLSATLVSLWASQRRALAFGCILINTMLAGLCFFLWNNTGFYELIMNGIGLLIVMEGLFLLGLSLQKEGLFFKLTLFLPPIWVGGIVYMIDSPSFAGHEFGFLSSVCCSVFLFLHARAAERALPFRHGADQTLAAALSRTSEAFRHLILVLQAEGQPEDPSMKTEQL